MEAKLYLFADEMRPAIRLARDQRLSRTEWLIRALNAYAVYAKCSVALVLAPAGGSQGLPESEVRGAVTLHRPRTPEEGEALVCGAANREDATGVRVEVVTANRRVVDALGASGCRIFDPARFTERLTGTLRAHGEKISAEPRQKYEGLSDAEVAYWLKLFTERDEEP